MPRSAAAASGLDVVGLGPVGVSVAALGSAWLPSLALAFGPLAAHPGPAAVAITEEPWTGGETREWLDIGTDLRLGAAGEELVVDDRRSGVRGRAIDGEVRLSSASPVPGPSGRVLPLCLAPALLDAGALLVHAATIGVDGRAVLVMGPTGAGKSTAVAAARAAGLDVLGDDLAVLWDDGGWCVHGLPRPVRVDPALAPGALPVPDDVRGRVSPEGWVTGGTADLAGVVLVGHGGVGEIVDADPVAIARAVVAAAFATALPRCVAPSLAIGRSLSERPAWHLALDADPDRRLAAAGRDLRRMLTESDDGQ